MSNSNKLKKLAEADGRYSPEAFELIFECLGATVSYVKTGKIKAIAPYSDSRSTKNDKTDFHISGRELLEGFKLFVIEQYGDMAMLLLQRWGLRSTEDVGEIVFLLCENNLMNRREDDTREEFADGFKFSDVFNANKKAGE
jgi:uncharacterized repeat protein (TIGR04138 family)